MFYRKYWFIFIIIKLTFLKYLNTFLLVVVMSYEQGFLDAILIVKHYLRKYGYNKDFWIKLKELEDAINEKRLEKIRIILTLLD